jgi:hypothetical protein
MRSMGLVTRPDPVEAAEIDKLPKRCELPK